MRFRAHIVGAPLHGTASLRGATAALLTWRSTRGAGRRPPPPRGFQRPAACGESTPLEGAAAAPRGGCAATQGGGATVRLPGSVTGERW